MMHVGRWTVGATSLLASALLLAACNHAAKDKAPGEKPADHAHSEKPADHAHSEKPADHAHSEKPADHAHGETPAAHPPSQLRLDDGKRWKADEHTRQSLAAIKSHLADPSLQGKALGDALDKAVQGLIQGCTMEGEAHNQLHHWLEPFMGQVQALQAGTAGAAEQVRASVTAFETHFE